MSNCPKSWSISRTCRLTAHTPRPRASSSGNRSGAAGADATASADSHAPKNISCSRLSCSLLGRHLPQVRHTSIAPMWSNRWICVRSQSETCAGPASRNADCSAAARDWSARMSHAPERWTTRAPSPATVTWTSGSRTGIDDSPSRQPSSNAAGTQRHDPAAFAYNRSRAPVAQWIEQPPPKGQVGRSIRLWGATDCAERNPWRCSAKITNGGTLRFPRCPSPTARQSDRVGLLRWLCRDESIQLHARLVYPCHRGIGLEVAFVEYRVEHLRHEAAIGHGDLVAKTVFAVLLLLQEKGFHHPEAFGDPMPVPGVHALFVELVGLADVFPHAQVVERMDLAGDDLRKGAHVGAVERVGGKELRPRINLVQVFDDRERLGQNPSAVLERGNQALCVERFIARLQVLAFGQAH